MKITLRAIHPIHITDGSIKEYSPLDYIFDKSSSRLYIIDLDKIFNAIRDIDVLDQIESKLSSGDISGLKNLIREKIQDISLISNYNILVDDVARNVLNSSLPEIIPYIKTISTNDYGIYIPGSSFKGALRTAILYCRFKETIDWSKLEKYIKTKNLHQLLIHLGLLVTKEKYYETYQLKDRRYVRKIDINKDPFSLIIIRDSNTLPLNNLLITKIVTIDFINNKIIEQLAEVVKENTSFKIELRIPKRLPFTSLDKKQYQLMNFKRLFKVEDVNNIDLVNEQLRDTIPQCINTYSRDLIAFDIEIIKEILSTSPCKYCNHYLNELNKLNKEIEKCGKREFIIPLGRFTGSLSKSLLILFIAHYIINYAKNIKLGSYLSSLLRHYYPNVKRIFPVSRRLSRGLSPLGWLKGKIE